MGTLGAILLCLALDEGRAPTKDERANLQRCIDLIRKACMGDAVADRLQKMLDGGQILVNTDKSVTEATAESGGAIILPERDAGGRTCDPLAFGHPDYNVAYASKVMEVAKTIVHELVHVDQDYFYRVNSEARHQVGKVPIFPAAPPNVKETLAWEEAIRFYLRLLECLHTELDREMNPVIQMVVDCKDLERGADWEDTPLTEAEKLRRVRRLVRLSGEAGTPEYYRELHNKLLFLDSVSEGVKHYVEEYDRHGYRGFLGAYPDYDIKKWEKRIKDARDFLDPLVKRSPPDDKKRILPCAGRKAPLALYLMNGGTAPPSVNASRLVVERGSTMSGGGWNVGGKEGAALPGADVRVTFPNGTTATVRADERGQFVVPNEQIPGDWDGKGLKVEQSVPTNLQPVPPGAIDSDKGRGPLAAKPGSVLPFSRVKVTFPDETTATTYAGADGGFSIPPEHLPKNFPGDVRQVKIETDFPPESLARLLRVICHCECPPEETPSGEKTSALHDPRAVRVTVTGKSRTSNLFEIKVENRSPRPFTVNVPRGTLVAVKNGQDGMIVEPIWDTVGPNGTKVYITDTVCYEMGVKPKVGLIAKNYVLLRDSDLGAVPAESEAATLRFEETGCVLVRPPKMTTDFLLQVDRTAAGGSFEGLPFDRKAAYQWSIWTWQGAEKKHFETIVLPQLEESPSFQKATPEKKDEMKKKYIEIPFERIRRTVEQSDKELKIEYTSVERKSAVTPPSVKIESARKDGK